MFKSTIATISRQQCQRTALKGLSRAPCLQFQSFSACASLQIKAKKLPPRPKVDESEIEEVFIKGGGNGGQKLNKTNSKVQLRHVPTGLVISSQATRSREQNRKHARELLALKVQEMEDPENCRLTLLKERKVQLKRSRIKKTKKKYRQLEEEQKLKEKQEQEEQPVLFKFE